jgi:hypothetical protein
LAPHRIVPSADGEISLYYFVETDLNDSPIKYASITSTEDGELVLLTVDNKASTPKIIEFPPDTGEERVHEALVEFLNPWHVL